jgi:dienelactone hydrolase
MNCHRNIHSDFRNLFLIAFAFLSPSLAAPPAYPNHQDVSYYVATDGTRKPIVTANDWQKRRAHILAGMEEVMGAFPRPKTPVTLDVQVLEEHKEDGYIRRKIAYHTDDPKARVNAWLLIPNDVAGLSEAGKTTKDAAGLTEAGYRRAAVLCLHQTNVRGKDSPAGLFERHNVHYAKELAQRGYVTLAPDYPSFGEASDYNFDADNYVSGSMKAIYDNTRAIDLLQSLPEVDPEKIGCIGHSLGGHNTLFTAAFDQRIKAAVTCCGFTSFHKYKGGNLAGWTSTRYMPLIKSKYGLSPDRMPFDFHEVIAAIAPRAVFVVAPLHDDNFDIEGVREVVTAARPIYKLLGHPENLQSVHPDTAHEFPDAERQQAYEFLDHHLKRHSKPKINE